ncbi:GNAT family N-acetyltransferase [Rhodocytophaga rosea]|uniref:GNAT family N-acetyltransferase n=1 Tax=Rhodocytophaga rosea TaxID=2704465 RepID=A0A6C0GTV3_9BACT|nr:GNAT family N-acetyltransferase [Rhodocytophaga rosea]QHT71244.1 GNAT family N-acetyltransferase [Rhodocytophaga rosea]
MENLNFRPSIGMLTMQYADAIQHLASDPEIAITTRVPHPYPEDGARSFIDMYAQEQKEGKVWNNVILNNNMFVGLCGLINIIPADKAEIGYWIGKPYWGRGFASFGVKMTLERAFQSLGLQLIYATILDFNKASMHVLEKNGFIFQRTQPHDNPKWNQDALLHVYELTKAQWMEHKYGKYLNDLHPDLKPILEAEIAPGNEVSSASVGWPKPDSILVSMKKPFILKHEKYSANVEYNELNDPHYWKAEYATLDPVHLIVCPFE